MKGDLSWLTRQLHSGLRVPQREARRINTGLQEPLRAAEPTERATGRRRSLPRFSPTDAH